MAPNTSNEPRGGCLRRGCLVFMFIFVVLGGLFGWSMYATYMHVYSITSDKPRTLPEFTYSPERYEHLEKEIAEFAHAARRGEADEFRLTGADLNTVFGHAREAAGFEGNVYFRIIENHLYMDCSLPLDTVPSLEGRWFNGEVVLGLLIEQERLQIEPKRIASGDKELPLGVLDAISKYDWTAYLPEETRRNLGYVRSVTIENNEIVLRTQPPQ